MALVCGAGAFFIFLTTDQMKTQLNVTYVSPDTLNPALYNPRKWGSEEKKKLTESIKRFGMVDPLIINSHSDRQNIVIGGHFRLEVAKELDFTEVPVVFVPLTEEKEKELNIRLNKNLGEFDYEKLAAFDEAFLADIGFSSKDLDSVFEVDPTPEMFDLQKELEKLNITEIEMQKGDLWQFGDSRLMVGDSTVPADMAKLMQGEKADMCLTDPPYILDYLHGKTNKGEARIEGFGAKKNRRYLETDELPDNFTELWMGNVMNQKQRTLVTKALLEELSKHGIVSAACKRAGLSRAQYYRWYKDDPKFKEAADEAHMLGTQEVNDLARSRLLQKIDQGESWAIRYHLSRRDGEYKLPPDRVGVQVAAEKDSLVAASYELLASALATGNITAAKFVLERLDVSLMRPKDQLFLKDIEEREKDRAQIEETRKLLSQLTGWKEQEGGES